MAMQYPNTTRRSSVLLVVMLVLVLLQIGSLNAQENPTEGSDPSLLEDEEEFDEASFEAMQFETKIIEADPGPDPSGIAPKLPVGEQPWWSKVKDVFSEQENLKRCFKRDDTPPIHGSICSDRPKSCLFGTQICPGDEQFPQLHCACKAEKWFCEPYNCPQCPEDPPSNTPDDEEVLTCPPGEGLTCKYDTVKW